MLSQNVELCARRDEVLAKAVKAVEHRAHTGDEGRVILMERAQPKASARSPVDQGVRLRSWVSTPRMASVMAVSAGSCSPRSAISASKPVRKPVLRRAAWG